MTAMNIPAHVPPELVCDFDFADARGEADFYRSYEKLHEGPDIFYTPHYGGHWVVTRFDDMERILVNAKDFSSRHATVPVQPAPVPLTESDAPIHTDFRKLLQHFFTADAVASREEYIRDLTVSLIEESYASGECEFCRDFAYKIPVFVTMNMNDLPLEDSSFFLQAADDIFHQTDTTIHRAAYGRLHAYLNEKVIPQRKVNPGSDMLSAIINGKVDGGRALTDEEMLMLLSMLIIAGLDTVSNTLSFMIMFLARNPAHRQQLIDDPTLINEAVEESCRRHQIANFCRVAVRDMDYMGVRLKAGDIVLIPTTLAGIDDRHFSDAMSVDFRRADKKHLLYGQGAHKCIGLLLARLELRVFLTEWVKRIPHFGIKAGEQPVIAPAKANCVRYLPLTWSIA